MKKEKREKLTEFFQTPFRKITERKVVQFYKIRKKLILISTEIDVKVV